MPDVIVTRPGSTKSWTITLRNSQGTALQNLYTADDTLSAQVWAGEDQAPLLVPTVAWVNAAAGTLKLTITAAQLAAAGVEDDIYDVSVTVTTASDGEPSVGWAGLLQVEDAPGTATALSAYASSGDLAAVAPEVGALQSRRADLAGFLAQRHEARVEFEARVIARYRPQPGRSRRSLDAAAQGPGPYVVLADSPDGSPPPATAAVRAWLDGDRLILTPEIRIANAYYAAALVFEDQVLANPQSANAYAALAVRYRERFDQAWPRCMVEFDATEADPPATPTHRIDRDVTYLT